MLCNATCMLINSFMQIFEDVCTFCTGTGCEVVMFYGCIFFLYPRHRRVLSNTAICLSVFLSHGAAALGYRHVGCLQLSHRRPSEMCGLRTRPPTDVDPPRVELPSAAGGGAYRLAAPGGAIPCLIIPLQLFTLCGVEFSRLCAVNWPLESVLRMLMGGRR